jgi:hypothetical protein
VFDKESMYIYVYYLYDVSCPHTVSFSDRGYIPNDEMRQILTELGEYMEPNEVCSECTTNIQFIQIVLQLRWL